MLQSAQRSAPARRPTSLATPLRAPQMSARTAPQRHNPHSSARQAAGQFYSFLGQRPRCRTRPQCWGRRPRNLNIFSPFRTTPFSPFKCPHRLCPPPIHAAILAALAMSRNGCAVFRSASAALGARPPPAPPFGLASPGRRAWARMKVSHPTTGDRRHAFRENCSAYSIRRAPLARRTGDAPDQSRA